MAQEESLALSEKLSACLGTINTSSLGTLLSYVCTESPLKALLVIVCLGAEKAAFALECMPECTRRPVIAALARGIQVPPGVFEHIITDAAASLQQMQLDESRRISVGLTDEFEDSFEYLIPLLNRQTVKSLLAILKEVDIERYNEVIASRVTFDEIMLLDDRDTQRVLKEVSFQELAAALRTAPEPLKEKIKRNVSKRIAARLEESMTAQDWQLSISDPEKMQDRIADTIRRLAKAAEIIIPRAGDRVV